MTLPDYLTLGSCDDADRTPHLLGETGLALPRSQCPSAQLTVWLSGAGIPGHARDVLETDRSFSGMAGLIRVPVERNGAYGVRLVWILARTAVGLTSIVVRDAKSASERQLHRDAAFAKEQASRYFARNAILLVQSRSTTDSMNEFARFAALCGQPWAKTDHLYSMQTGSDPGLSSAWLAPPSLSNRC